ncbi:glycosyltransferase family 4 protein [Actinocatenispora rupis]|uniref:Glycosyl transferase n=1 Tax=Actinocatenispora rupis TaxID=519421 RepID=A0A8J3J4U4_9ACTN|nr:glycosyltransferase family 4 protein [Actinocatenispora rupis]GID11987.1 glycosyl transferase [Actinocatenispora rupis]
MGERSRVALVLGTSTGGIGRHVRSLAAGLSADGYRVTVLGPPDTEVRFGFTAVGAGFRPVGIAAGLDPVRDGGAVAALRRGLRDADVVHAHGMRAGLLAAVARPRTAPLVVTWHNVLMAGGLSGRVLGVLERVVARSATVCLCASDDLVGRLLALGARDVRPAPVAAPVLSEPTTAAADVRRALGASDRPLVLSVGRLHPQKGYDLLVDAAAGWRDRDPVPLVAIAGSGPAEEDLAARIAASGAPVVLLGHRDDVADLLAACDVAVVSSRWEARQLFAQEALRAGRPLVTTAVGGVPGLVGDAAVLVPVRDDAATVAALSAAVTGVLDDPDRAGTYAAAGPRRAATWPTEADTLSRVEAVYAELLGSDG